MRTAARPFTALILIIGGLCLIVLGALALALVAIRPLAAQGIIVPRCGPASDCVRPIPIADWVVRGASRVHVTLADRVLHYEVDETFINRGNRVGEADYIFPLPKNAAFADLKLSINGELVGGETMDAGHARGIYEEIVRRQRDPALVEWMGFGMLRTRIFPIQPGEEKRVVVRFDQVVEREGDALRIEYVRGTPPSTPTPRPMSIRGEDGTGRSTFTLTYPATSGYGEPYSPTHELDVSDRDGQRRVNVLGDAREVTVLIPVRRSSDAASISMLANASGHEDGFALITLTPPAGLRATAPRDVTFVLDVSGSMSGRKMEQARAAGRQLLATLSPRDRFRLIDFSTDVRTFRDDFEYATPQNLRAAERYLDALTAEGSTNIAGALEEALRPGRTATENGGDDANVDDDRRVRSSDRLPLVLFITDGEPTVGERRPDALTALASRLRGRARLFTFGLGADVNASLLEQLALEGHGTANFVRPTENVERIVSLVASRLTNPIATDVRVHAEGVRLNKVLPQGAVDLFAGQDLVLFARYAGSGRATIVFDGNTPNGAVHWSEQVEFPEHERENGFVPRLWATQRVGYLSAERRKHGGSPELDDEIRSLGARYGIPTEFTSFLVQEPGIVAGQPMDMPIRMRDDIERRRGAIDQAASVNAPVAPAPTANFEAAKTATAQRAATSLAAADSVAFAGREKKDAASMRHVGDRLFVLRDGVWTDTRYHEQTGKSQLVRVRPYSDAYFKLLELVPDLKAPFALGDRVVVMGRTVAIELAADGMSTLGDKEQVVRGGF